MKKCITNRELNEMSVIIIPLTTTTAWIKPNKCLSPRVSVKYNIRKSFTDRVFEMLKSFAVKGYRNFESELKLNLDCAHDYQFNTDAVEGKFVKCGLIYGRNAAGKSNLGLSIADIQSNMSRITPGIITDYRGQTNFLNGNTCANEVSFKYVFHLNGHDYTYKYEKDQRRMLLHEKLLHDDKVLFDYDHRTGQFNQLYAEGFGGTTLTWNFNDREISILGYISNNIPKDQLNGLYDLYDFITHMLLFENGAITAGHVSAESLVVHLLTLNLVEEFSAFLEHFGIEEEVVVEDSPSGNPELYFKYRNRLVNFADNCSSGISALLSLFVMVEEFKPSFVFIDEFDAYYHHDLAKQVIEYLKQCNCRQVLCTTHNTDLFSNEVLRPDCLFVMTSSKILSAVEATERELREGHNLEKLYKAGEFNV